MKIVIKYLRRSKNLFYSLVSILHLSCNENSQTEVNIAKNSNFTNHAQELIDNDFLKFADSAKVDSLIAQLTNSFDIYNDDNFKIAHIDAEELSEFSFNFFLPNLNRILAQRDFELSTQKLNEDENSFDILINGDTLQLYSQNDLNDNSFWDKAPRNYFKKINELLKLKKFDEQFYLLYGGNDLHVILLTDKQYSIILDYYKNNDKEKPCKP